MTRRPKLSEASSSICLHSQARRAKLRVRLFHYSLNVSFTDCAADAVILTSGGFGSDRGNAEDSLMKEFAAEKLHYATTNGAFAQGEGMKMARRVGANLIDMDRVQV